MYIVRSISPGTAVPVPQYMSSESHFSAGIVCQGNAHTRYIVDIHMYDGPLHHCCTTTTINNNCCLYPISDTSKKYFQNRQLAYYILVSYVLRTQYKILQIVVTQRGGSQPLCTEKRKQKTEKNTSLQQRQPYQKLQETTSIIYLVPGMFKHSYHTHVYIPFRRNPRNSCRGSDLRPPPNRTAYVRVTLSSSNHSYPPSKSDLMSSRDKSEALLSNRDILLIQGRESSYHTEANAGRNLLVVFSFSCQAQFTAQQVFSYVRF